MKHLTSLMLGSLALGTLLSAGCDQLKVTPVAMQESPLAGRWFGEMREDLGHEQVWRRLFVHVQAEGYTYYHSLICRFPNDALGAPSVSELIIEPTPIKRVSQKRLVLQSYPLTPKFQLTIGGWPADNAGRWILDEMALNRVAAAAAPQDRAWVCEHGTNENRTEEI